MKPEPKGRARGPHTFTRRHARLVQAFERPEKCLVVAGQSGGPGETLQIVTVEWAARIGASERLEGFGPGPMIVKISAALNVVVGGQTAPCSRLPRLVHAIS